MIRRALPILVACAAALGAVAAAIVWRGQVRWAAATREVRARLEAARVAPTVARFDPAELDGLPDPVRAYLARALVPGQAIVVAVTVEHRGTFNMGEDTDRWVPFVSTQRVTTHPAGFDWDARVRLMPVVGIRVRDAYVGGSGILVARLLGAITVMEEPPSEELDRGELMRWVAEAAWYPTALLPSQGARWDPVDARHARLTLGDGRREETFTVGFGDDGLLETVRAESRTRVSGGTRTAMVWQGHFGGHERRDGMLVPLVGEVAWLPSQGAPQPYWRGRITRIAYEFAE